MNLSVIVLSISLLIHSPCTAQVVDFPAPENVRGEASSDSVILTWDVVDGASQYFVSFENGQSQLTPNNRITFNQLEANTEYTVIISAADENGTTSTQSAIFTIETLSPRVSNLRVSAATETEIVITWDMRNDTSGYNVIIKSSDDKMTDAKPVVDDGTATISGLKSFTYYNIYVTSKSSEGESDEAFIRARTDGSGVRIMSLWEGYEGVFGGEAMLFRPLVISKEAYVVKAEFPCGLASVLAWNAKLDKRASSLDEGMIYVRQQKLWEREKTEIGVNFYFDIEASGFVCDIGNDSITARFGVEDPSADIVISTTSVPVSVTEWRNTTRTPVTSAGIVYVKLRDVYTDTSVMVNATNPKPAIYQYIIVVKSGPDCPGGIDFRYGWGMTAKESDDIEDSQPGSLYFVQKNTQWYSNEPGFIYGYDPEVCFNRNGITAEVMVGGSFVDDVIDAENANAEA